MAFPPFSNIVLPSMTLSFEGIPTAMPLVVSPALIPPPPFSSSALPLIVFSFEPSSRMPSPEVPKISLPSIVFLSERSIQTPSFPFTEMLLCSMTLNCALFVIQRPWSLTTIMLFRMVLLSTFESYDAGGSGGCGSAGSTGYGRPRAMPASWFCWTRISSTMLRVVPWLSITP